MGRMKVVKKLWTKSEAVAARQAGQDVKMVRKQAAKEVQNAANHGKGITPAEAHPLRNGKKGDPHFHPADRSVGGHTFWGTISILIGVGWDLLQPPAFDVIEGETAGNSCDERPAGCL